jgi:hypothetical protein
MRPYTFDQFRRDWRHFGKVPWGIRLGWWLRRMPLDRWNSITEAGRRFSKVADAVGAAMTPGERANPSTLSEWRRKEIADAAHITDQELNDLLTIFEQFPESARQWRRVWWEMFLIDALGIGLHLLIFGLLIVAALLIRDLAF